MSQTLMQGLITAGLLILSGVISITTPFIIAYFNKKTQSLDVQINAETTAQYLKILNDAVKKSVRAVNQTFVDDLKKDGNFTPEMQKQAFNKALLEINAILSDSAKEALTVSLGSLEQYISTAIEAEVKEQK